jgi:hypothetical protein
MWYPMRDVRAFFAYRRTGEIKFRTWLRSIARHHHYPVGSKSDRRPALAHSLRVLTRLRGLFTRTRAKRAVNSGNGAGV